MVAEFEDTYNSLKRFPIFFLQLTDGEEWPICNYKDSVLNFTDPKAPMRWVGLERDNAIGTVKEDHEAGFVSFRLFIREVNDQSTKNF